MLGQQFLDPLAVDLSIDQRIVDAAPATRDPLEARLRFAAESMGPVVKASVRSKSASRRRVKRRYIGFRNVVSGSKEEVVMPPLSHIGLVLSDSVCYVDLAG